jgi:hypothetical protein
MSDISLDIGQIVGGPEIAQLDLDALYGEAKEPTRPVSEHECKHTQVSLQRLDSTSAPALAEHMGTVSEQKLAFQTFLHEVAPFIWLIDSCGEFWFALEEAVGPTRAILSTKLPPEGYVKLGHPAILTNQGTLEARIGGELGFDPAFNADYPWVLTNASGRYGIGMGRTSVHLENVKELLSGFGINVCTIMY